MDTSALAQLVRDHRQGVLITLKSDGRPQSSNIVYVVDGDVIRISTTDDRAKTANLRRDPRASLHVIGDDFWTYAVVEGTASLSPVAQEPDDDTVEQLVAYYRQLQGEHEDWDDYRAAMVRDRRLVVELTMDHLYGLA